MSLFYESSALNRYNIDKIFSDCCLKIYNLMSNMEEEELPGISKGKYTKKEINNSLKISLIDENEENNNKRGNNSRSCCC